MDDKTFIASYVAKESQRINERMKSVLDAEVKPSEEEINAIISDIETTLGRLEKALSHIQMDDETLEELPLSEQ